MHESNADKINRYLTNQMTNEEIAEFEKEIEQNEELEKELTFQKTLKDGLKTNFKDEKKEMLQRHEARKNSSSNRVKWYLAAAALVILGIGVGWFTVQNNTNSPFPEQIAKQEFNPYPNYLTEQYRNYEESAKPKILLKAMQAYDNQQFEKAQSALQEAVDNEEGLPISRFYLGNTLLALEKPENAIYHFIKVRGKLDQSFKYQNQWYLALAYLFKNQAEQGKQYLKKLTDKKNPYQQKAKQLLSKLEKQP